MTQWRSLDRLWLCKSLWEDAGRLGHVGTCWDMLGHVGTDQIWQIKILTPKWPMSRLHSFRSRQGNWLWWWCASHLQRLEWWMLMNVGHLPRSAWDLHRFTNPILVKQEDLRDFAASLEWLRNSPSINHQSAPKPFAAHGEASHSEWHDFFGIPVSFHDPKSKALRKAMVKLIHCMFNVQLTYDRQSSGLASFKHLGVQCSVKDWRIWRRRFFVRHNLVGS